MDIRNETPAPAVSPAPALAVLGESDAVLQRVASRYLGLGLGPIVPPASPLLSPLVTASPIAGAVPGSQEGLDGALAAFSLDIAFLPQGSGLAGATTGWLPGVALAGLFPPGSDLGAAAAGLSGSLGLGDDASGLEGWGIAAPLGAVTEQIGGGASEMRPAAKWSGVPTLPVVGGVADPGVGGDDSDLSDGCLVDGPGFPAGGPGAPVGASNGRGGAAIPAGMLNERRAEVPGLPDRPAATVDARGAKVLKGDVFEALAEWGRLETNVRGVDRLRGNSLDVLLLPDWVARVRAAKASRGLGLGLLGGLGGDASTQGPVGEADLITRADPRFFNRRVHRVLRKDPRDQRKKKSRDGDAGEGLSQDGEITAAGGI